jgi:predicted alpha/beta hydrolase family esterase
MRRAAGAPPAGDAAIAAGRYHAMTALILCVLLVAGAAAYVRWANLLVEHGATAWWFVVGAPIAYLVPVLVLVSIWFLLSWIWRTPRPPAARLDARGCVRLFVGEVLAVAGSWPLMALHRLLIHDPPPAPSEFPVILVHGVLVNDGMWFWMRSYLSRRGVRGVYTINFGPPHADIERFAQQLAAKIDAVCAATGAASVLLVGHSMGGLVARACVRRYGTARVSRIVTIGTPHHGSMLAWTWPGRCLAQMRPGNAWLAELNRDESRAPPVSIASIWSRHDSMVAPQASSEIAGAENVAIVGAGHNALVGDRGVMELVASRILDTRSRRE